MICAAASQVKVSNKFAFPLELDMGGMLSSDAPQLQNESEYELSAVLLHKGSNATSGHYGGAHAQTCSLKNCGVKKVQDSRLPWCCLICSCAGEERAGWVLVGVQ